MFSHNEFMYALQGNACAFEMCGVAVIDVGRRLCFFYPVVKQMIHKLNRVNGSFSLFGCCGEK